MTNDTLAPSAAPARRSNALPELRSLEAFVTVCEAGSMSHAAQRLGVSQSAVSQMIRALEQQYDLQLFDREMRPARPTRAGGSLLGLARSLLEHAREVTGQLRASARQDYTRIRLGCVDSFAATVGPELVRALSGSARELQLWSGLTPGLSAQLQARELDLAICTETALDDPRITQRLLFSEEWVVVMPARSPGRPLPSPARPQSLKTLVRHLGELPLVRYSQRSVIGQQIDRYLTHLGLPMPRRFEFDATDPLLSLVAAGLGWAISTPLCLWQSRSWLDQVQVLPLPASRLGQRDFFVLCRDNEWTGLDDEVVRVSRQVLMQDTLPALRRLMPALPADIIRIPDKPAA
jgi:DNA-binding transcriptional LysR family regulator